MRSFLKTLWKTPEQKASLADPELLALLAGQGQTAAGVAVTPETALRCSPVFGCVRVLAESVAQLPLQLYRKTGDARERATDHPVYDLIVSAPNEWTTPTEFKMVLTSALSLHGNGFAFVNRVAGNVREIIPLDSRAVTVETDPGSLEPVYKLHSAAGVRVLSRREIIHLRGIGPDPVKGVSPIAEAREAIGLAMVLEAHGAGLFGRGARPSGLLKYGKTLAADISDRLRQSFERFHKGSENAGRTLVLEDGMEFQPLQLTSVDAQFFQLRQFQIQEISRFFRVPLHLLNDLERATHNNAEAMGQQFLTFCLLPLLRIWTDALKLTLLTPEERREYYFEFIVDDIARANLAARFTAYSQAINAGVLNPNEARALENRAPYAGGETFMRPVNTAPAPVTEGAPNAVS